MEFVMDLIIWVCGVIFGVVIMYTRKPSGTLRIDHSNPEKDIYRMEFEGDLDELNKKKRIILKVDNNANLSQE